MKIISFILYTNISILHINCRSIKNKTDNLQKLLNSLNVKFDIIALTETWLSDKDDLNFYNMKGYKTEFQHRKKKQGGGLLSMSMINSQ